MSQELISLQHQPHERMPTRDPALPTTTPAATRAAQSVKRGFTRVGGQYLNTKAQAQFCLVKIKVKNINDETHHVRR